MGFCEVADDVCHDAFKHFADGAFQCDRPVCFGLGVVRLVWFPEDNGCGFLKSVREVSKVEAGLCKVLEMAFNLREDILEDAVADLVWSGGFVGVELIDCLLYL